MIIVIYFIFPYKLCDSSVEDEMLLLQLVLHCCAFCLPMKEFFSLSRRGRCLVQILCFSPQGLKLETHHQSMTQWCILLAATNVLPSIYNVSRPHIPVKSAFVLAVDTWHSHLLTGVGAHQLTITIPIGLWPSDPLLICARPLLIRQHWVGISW